MDRRKVGPFSDLETHGRQLEDLLRRNQRYGNSFVVIYIFVFFSEYALECSLSQDDSEES